MQLLKAVSKTLINILQNANQIQVIVCTSCIGCFDRELIEHEDPPCTYPVMTLLKYSVTVGRCYLKHDMALYYCIRYRYDGKQSSIIWNWSYVNLSLHNKPAYITKKAQ
ncbi:uncharacterized protein LOC134282463 [Saccostrea cucullata]|uniref:uncharacterized protein LOC134282463 n=1 Tax=Saccostrea cuccullata TaxID=36930 RepID=UPI002ED5DC85